MRYTITLYNKFKRPYFYVDNDDRKCINTESSTYETEDKELAKQIIKDFMDVPEAELSLDEIRKQFEDPSYSILSEAKLRSIQRYYNGRLNLYNTIIKEFSEIKDKTDFFKIYDIPYDMNHFTVEDNLEEEKQLDAFIEVKVEK